MYPLSRTQISPPKAARSQYSETQAADLLGLSIEELRTLVREHIASGEESSNGAVTVFHSSDLLVMRILAGKMGQSSSAQ